MEKRKRRTPSHKHTSPRDGKPTEIDPGQEEGSGPIRLFATLIARVDSEHYSKSNQIATDFETA
jgi:hypothetical protein